MNKVGVIRQERPRVCVCALSPNLLINVSLDNCYGFIASEKFIDKCKSLLRCIHNNLNEMIPIEIAVNWWKPNIVNQTKFNN